MTQLVRLQSPATSLVLLRFCLSRCLISCHARTMPADRPPPLCPADAGLPQALPRWNHPCYHHTGCLIPGTCLHQQRWLRHQGPLFFHSPAAFLASSSCTAPLCNSLWSEYNNIHDTDDPNVAAAEAQVRRCIWEATGRRDMHPELLVQPVRRTHTNWTP